MNKTNPNDETVTGPVRDGSIASLCAVFEREWGLGHRPRIETFLEGWEEPERSKLLYELLRQEIEFCRALGTMSGPDDYQSRFPEHRHVVEEAFLCTVVGAQAEESLVVRSTLQPRGILGQGGLGIVYLADDRQLQRDSAVKFLQDSLRGDPLSREQFRLEAEITSRLEHPGVVPVYGLGETADGRLFYVMRLIQGERLDAVVARFHQQLGETSAGTTSRQVGFHELLQEFVTVCNTIAYAHNRGIVHRDIKPGNIMRGRYGQTLVIDWGLAMYVERKGVFKSSDEKTLMPAAGSGSSQNSGGGTPPYMSPEQVAGRDDLGPASDIYSLGATLYTILTGQVPFRGSVTEIMDKVTRGDFLRPSSINVRVPRAMEAICLKAMALDPQRRYSTAMELADDVERFLADAPVSAYQESLVGRLARWSRRNRTLAQSLLVALVLVAVLGSVAAVWQGRQVVREKQLREQAVIARKLEQELRTRGLQVSAEFAARTIANQIDIRWRLLEKEAMDPRLHELLRAANTDAGRTEVIRREELKPIQQWLDDRVGGEYASVSAWSWFVQDQKGAQLARVPSHDDHGEPFKSLGQSFAYRDYFHGRGQDYAPSEPLTFRPLDGPHNSTVFGSVNGGDLLVVLSVPVRPREGETLGVLAMSIELGRFADLQIRLPEGQAVLLVESRTYYMLPDSPGQQPERGEGLVLHHEKLRQALSRAPLPHFDDRTVHFMRTARPAWQTPRDGSAPGVNLLPDDYRDPVEGDRDGRWSAAFAPVLISGRRGPQQDTGWFVIVEQRQAKSP